MAFVVVNWVTTQRAARLFGYSPALGETVGCKFPMAGALYQSVEVDRLVVALALEADTHPAMGAMCAH